MLCKADCQQRPREKRDRKSTRLNSSHSQTSYAVFCLKKKKQRNPDKRGMQPGCAVTITASSKPTASVALRAAPKSSLLQYARVAATLRPDVSSPRFPS